MKLAAVMVAIATGMATAQSAPDVGAEQQGVRQAVLDYAEGYYDRSPERMTRAISPLLTKRSLEARPGMPSYLSQMNSEMLIQATRGTGMRPAAEARRMVVEVLDITGDVASARVFSVQFNDYVHLVKREGRWQLVSVLWHAPPTSPADAGQNAAVEKAAQEYAAALAGNERQRAVAVLSPVAALRTFLASASGPGVLRDQNTEATVAVIASRKAPREDPVPSVTVLGVDVDMASVKLGTGPATTYLHLALMNGQWVVVNTLNAVTGR